MKVKNGKILEATENELFSRWVKTGYCEFYDFITYVFMMKKAGVKVVDEGGQNEA